MQILKYMLFLALLLLCSEFPGFWCWAFFGLIIWEVYKYAKRRRRIERIKSEINNHIKTLSIKADQLIIPDDYGVFDTSKWEKEKRYFIDKVLYPLFSGKIDIERSLISDLIQDAVEECRRNSSIPEITFNKNMSPQQYERYCAKLLSDSGWKTKLTKTTGDQGIDILAFKDGETAVIQCKKYSQPVGNKAVQEVFAAKGFAKAKAAAVVSNAGYTRAAKELANSLGVELLHHSELPKLEKKLKVTS